MLLKIAFLILMTSPDDVIFLKFSEIHGQYFPLSNFKKKDTLVFSSLSSIRLGLSPKGLAKRKRPRLYRVGTLGIENFESIKSTIKSFYSSKCPKKLFVVGDFNLKRVDWFPEDEIVSPCTLIEDAFVTMFHNFGLEQCINIPTHVKGNIFDLLLCNHKSMVKDLKVRKDSSPCKSDHYPITFNVDTKINYSKCPKRKIYNFKKANSGAVSKIPTNQRTRGRFVEPIREHACDES